MKLFKKTPMSTLKPYYFGAQIIGDADYLEFSVPELRNEATDDAPYNGVVGVYWRKTSNDNHNRWFQAPYSFPDDTVNFTIGNGTIRITTTITIPVDYAVNVTTA
jgi:hypothetical protein